MGNGIPRRIIQTSKNHELPLIARAASTNVRLLNPDYEYIFFTDEDIDKFINLNYPQYKDAFYAFKYPIQRIDFFRYLAIYKLGGFYFDLDVFLASSLDDLLDNSCIFPFEELTANGFLKREYDMDWEIGNYAFGASPGHPFIAAIIKNCLRAQSEPAWVEPMLKAYPKIFHDRFYVLCTTGPGLITRTFAEYTDAAERVNVLFPEDVCDPKTWHRFGSYGVHMMEGTWLRNRSILYKLYTRLWDAWMLKRVLKDGIKRGRTRM